MCYDVCVVVWHLVCFSKWLWLEVCGVWCIVCHSLWGVPICMLNVLQRPCSGVMCFATLWYVLMYPEYHTICYGMQHFATYTVCHSMLGNVL